ncbi:MAG: hypothetical protein JRH11_06655, partial [Deltaproteobacteria bacterium]|nr:hypothetical protein [Deltaproteobacteria bacterium]
MALVVPVASVTLPACGDDTGQTTADPAPAASTGEETTAPSVEDPAANETPAPAPAAEGAIPIVPGRSIGPIQLSMTRAAVDALGLLSPHPQYSAMTVPFTVYYDDSGRVHQVEVSLLHAGADIQVGSVIIPPTADMGQAKALLGDCSADDLAIGGTTSTCRDGGLQVIIGSGDPNEVWLRIPIAG